MEDSFIVTVKFGVFLLSLIGFVQSSCDLCSPGEFLSSPCNCLPCPNNTFTDKLNNDSKCRPCKKRCEPSMVVEKKCNKSHDTVCACKPGKYLDPGILFCVDCAVCSAGYGAARPCSTDSNTVCLPCIPGKTYSNATSFSAPCKACTVCQTGYSIELNCTKTRNAICKLSNTANTTRPRTKTRTTKVPVSSTNQSIASQQSKEKEYVIPVLVVVVLLIFGLLIGLIIIVYRRSRAHRQPAAAGHDSEDGEEVVPIKPKSVAMTTSRHGGLRGRRTRHLRRHDNGRESDSQGSSTGSLQEEKPRDPERLLRDLPNETLVIEHLAHLLNPKSRNNWLRLAGELGYSKTTVDNFGMQPTNATQNLLGDWRTMNSSTLGKLYGCLKKMKRDDACEVLESV